MKINEHWQQWPFYCSEWGDASLTGPMGKQTHYNNAWSEEVKLLNAKHATMAAVIRQLREYECDPGFILSQLQSFFAKPSSGHKLTAATQYRYSPTLTLTLTLTLVFGSLVKGAH